MLASKKHTSLNPMSPELGDWRRHFGSTESHFFEVTFTGETERQLLNVQELWEAARAGKTASYFRYAPLIQSQRQLLRSIAEGAL